MAINPPSDSPLEQSPHGSPPLTALWVSAMEDSNSVDKLSAYGSAPAGLQVTETIEYNFVAVPPAPPRRPAALVAWEPEEKGLGLTPWSLGGLIFFMVANGAILWHQWQAPPSPTPLQQLSALPPWQSASTLSVGEVSPSEPLNLKNLSKLKPLPAPTVAPLSRSLPSPPSPVKLAPRLSPPPPLPSLPLASQIVPPTPKIVKPPLPEIIMPTVAVRPAVSQPPALGQSGGPNPMTLVEGNSPIEVVGAPPSSSLPDPTKALPQELTSPGEPPSFNHQTRQHLLKIHNLGGESPGGGGESHKTQQLIQELENLNQAQ